MKVLIFSLILLMAQACFADCGKFLTMPNDTATNSVTYQFLSFVAVLLEQRVISEDYLSILVKGKIRSPFTAIRDSSKQDIYEPYFTAYLEQDLDKEKIKTWAQEKLQNAKAVQEKKTESKNKTQNPFYKMKFHKIAGGTFDIGPGRNNKTDQKIRVIVPDFAMMETKVTESMWAEVMGGIPKTTGQFYPFVLPNGKRVNIFPDMPVTAVSWWSVIEFANRLSILHGLEPVYLFNKEELAWIGQAEDGSLIVRLNDSIDFNINAPDGDVHRAKGYRLPTRAELEFAMTDRGRSTTSYFSDMNDKNLAQYNHFDMSLHEVAQLLPNVIDGMPFFDLYGNGAEWTMDFSNTVEFTRDGYVSKDYTSERRIIKLGNTSANNGYAPQFSDSFAARGIVRFKNLGFRLVRSLP